MALVSRRTSLLSRTALLSHPSFPFGSTVELTDPRTGCQVILLGCFHGSPSSALDVRACLSQPPSTVNKEDDVGLSSDQVLVVALELCASRFEDLRKEVLKSSSEEYLLPVSKKTKKTWFLRFVDMVRKTSSQRGWSAGFATALLVGISGWQTALSGLEPGLEFRTALEYVVEKESRDVANKDAPTAASVPTRCDIVLADQCVDETLTKIGKLPIVAAQLWADFFHKGWDQSFGVESSTLARAVGFPTTTWKNGQDVNGITFWGFVTRSSSSVRDMTRLLLPPLLTLQVLLFLLNCGFEFLCAPDSSVPFQNSWIDSAIPVAGNTPMDSAALSSLLLPNLSDLFILTLTNGMSLALFYLSIVLPAVRIVLRERDDVLSRGIQEACRLATKTTGHGRVVAILGLLHVNGVQVRLLEEAPTDNPF